MQDHEFAAAVLQPHFDAVRDVFASYVPTAGERLAKLAKVRFVIEPRIHDTTRHFAATRDDGKIMYFAPEFVDLPVETVVAILAHEFGHAADFAYPARWLLPPGNPGSAQWVDDPESKAARKWRSLWRQRNDYSQDQDRSQAARHARDQIEWTADAIAQTVTGKRIGYAGPCLLQTFRRTAVERPAGLR